IDENILHCTAVMRALKTLVSTIKQGEGKLSAAQARAEAILEIGEDFMRFLAESGIETADTPLILACKRAAEQISARFEQAVESGEIGMDALFDENYVEIPRTDPQQFMTRFVT